MKDRLRPLSRVKPQLEMDTVAHSKQFEQRRAFDVLMEAQEYWNNMSRFRLDRERNKRYCYGDQWQDIITVDGKEMTEEEYIKCQGQVPLKNNLIRRLVRNVLGVYRSQNKVPVCFARDRNEQELAEGNSSLLRFNMQLNKMTEMNARSKEEFLISGFVCYRKSFGWRREQLDCWTDSVAPNNFFVDTNMRDYRGWDVSCIGEIHDVDFGTLCSNFAHSAEDYRRLRDIYRMAHKKSYLVSTVERFGYSRLQNYDFLFTSDPTRCRVIEVWRKESKPRYRCHDYNTGEVYKIELEDYGEMVERVNADRLSRGQMSGMRREDIPLIESEWFMDNYWYYYYLSPFGDVLQEGETPYEHKSHPYVFKAYPYLDGEIHSFVADMIDQQRYVNRLVTLHDWVMRSSAKGVLLVPEESVGNMSLEEIADEWSRFNGVIAIKTRNGTPLPQQLSVNATNIGISELLNLQLKFFEDISGVHGALQGKPGNSSTSGTLYAQQTQNATTSLLDLLDSFNSFINDGAYKDLKNILQYYPDKKIEGIIGRQLGVKIDPHRIRDVEWDTRIAESTDTPGERQIANDFLLEVWRSGELGLRAILETGDFPYADKLIQYLDAQESKMQQGMTPDAVPSSVRQGAEQGADMTAVNRAYSMLKPRAANR